MSATTQPRANGDPSVKIGPGSPLISMWIYYEHLSDSIKRSTNEQACISSSHRDANAAKHADAAPNIGAGDSVAESGSNAIFQRVSRHPFILRNIAWANRSQLT